MSIINPAIDGVYIARKAKNSSFYDNPSAGWEILRTPGNETEYLRILGYGSANPGLETWNNSQVWLYTVIGPVQGMDPSENSGYTHRGYVSCNGPNIVGNYSVAIVRSNDPFSDDWVWGEQVLVHAGSGLSYWGPKVYRESATRWHMLVPRLGSATEGRVVRLQYYFSTDGIDWNDFVLDDIFFGKEMDGGPGFVGGGYVEGGHYHFPVVEGDVGPYAGSLPGVGKEFDEPWGSKVVMWRVENLEFDNINAYVRGETIFTQQFQAQQNLGGGENLSDMISYLGRRSMMLTTYKWRSQTALVPTTEQYSNGKMLVEGAPVTVDQGPVIQQEVYPWYIDGFLKPSQQHVSESVPYPIDVYTGEAGLTVGSPETRFGNSISAVGGGYVWFDKNIVTDTRHHAHQFMYYILGSGANHGFMQIGGSFVYEWIGGTGTGRLWAFGEDSGGSVLIKKYRCATNGVTPLSMNTLCGQIDVNGMANIGCLARWNDVDDVEISMIIDFRVLTQSMMIKEHVGTIKFHQLHVNPDLGVYFGKTFDGSLGESSALNVVGPLVYYNGTTHATEANILRTDII